MTGAINDEGVGDQTSRYSAMTSARLMRWFCPLAVVNTGLSTPPKKRSRSLVGLERRQQLLAVVVGRRMRHQLVAVIHHGTFETLAVEAETAHQRMDGYQHRPGDVVGIDTVASHQQHGRARRRTVNASCSNSSTHSRPSAAAWCGLRQEPCNRRSSRDLMTKLGAVASP